MIGCVIRVIKLGKIMKNFSIAMTIALFSTVSLASNEGCTWDNKFVPFGESVYVQDPAMVKIVTENLVREGISLSKAQVRAENNDWVGFVLECTKAFSIGQTVDKVGSVIKVDSYHMVLIDHQKKWYEQILKHDAQSQ
jgi:hypothetical protein